VQLLDRGLAHLADIVRRDVGVEIRSLPGAGAAGGFGGGAVAFFDAMLQPGIQAVLDTVGFETLLEQTDLVITGEGRIDSQSVHGKVISGIARRTAPRNVPLVAIVGSIHESAAEAYNLGVTAMFGIDREAVAFECYAHRTGEYYRRTLEDVLRLIRGMNPHT
jgi:glycerate kinase